MQFWSILCPKCSAVLAMPGLDDTEQVCPLCREIIPLRKVSPVPAAKPVSGDQVPLGAWSASPPASPTRTDSLLTPAVRAMLESHGVDPNRWAPTLVIGPEPTRPNWVETPNVSLKPTFRDGLREFVVDVKRCFVGTVTGLVPGLVAGAFLFAVSWVLKTLLGVPPWFSLATLVNAVILALVGGCIAAGLRSEGKARGYDASSVFAIYVLVSLLGAVGGCWRWYAGLKTPIANSVWHAGRAAGAYVVQKGGVEGGMLYVVLWLVVLWLIGTCIIAINTGSPSSLPSFEQFVKLCTYSIKFFNIVLISILGISLVLCALTYILVDASLLEASLFSSDVSRFVDGNPLVVTLTCMAGVRCFLGAILAFPTSPLRGGGAIPRAQSDRR